MKLYKTFRKLSKIIPYPDLQKAQMFVEWKNRLLFVTLAGIVFLGFIAYVPSIILAVKQNLWAVVVVDTIVYCSVLVIAFSPKISGEVKVNATLIIFYFLGTALLIILGKEGAGFNWLFLFPMLSSFFYGYRGVLVSTIVDTITLTLLFIPVWFNMKQVGLIADYNTGGWIINSINFLVITILLSMGLTVIISNIYKSLRKEKRIIGLLQKSQSQLKIQKKRAEESDRLKSAFLSNMSHEIRTPLNAIIGFSDLIANTELPKEKLKKFGSLIDMAGSQLITIIDDIIDISKIEHGQMDLQIKPMEIYKNLKSIVDIHASRINSLQKNIDLKLEVNDNLKDIVIETDEGRFKQVATNLIGNAIKYTEEGTVSVGYTLKKSSGKSFVEFFVKDTGRGIPKDSYNKIFERFAQADNVEFHEGTGLGLSITKGLLELLGGKIWLHSEVNKGSKFYFTLPAPSAVSSQSSVVNEKTDSTEFPQLEGKLIYVAEDDNFSFSLIYEILETLSVTVKRAENGRELLQLIDNKVPDLILLDIKMPEMDGITAIDEIRAQYPDLPVIAQTAYAMREEQEKYLQHGFNACITKPFKQEEFIHVVNTWLGKNDK